MKKILILSCALALAGLSTSAMAAQGQAFVRAEVGDTDVDFNIDGLAKGSDNDTSYSVRGGYYFTDNLAVEGSYNSLYDNSNNGASAKVQSIGVGAVAKKNFGANNTGFFIAGRVGIEYVKGELSDSNNSFEDNSTKPYFGVGAGYDVNESFGLSVNYSFNKGNFEVLSFDAETVSVAGEYRF